MQPAAAKYRLSRAVSHCRRRQHPRQKIILHVRAYVVVQRQHTQLDIRGELDEALGMPDPTTLTMKVDTDAHSGSQIAILELFIDMIECCDQLSGTAAAECRIRPALYRKLELAKLLMNLDRPKLNLRVHLTKSISTGHERKVKARERAHAESNSAYQPGRQRKHLAT